MDQPASPQRSFCNLFFCCKVCQKGTDRGQALLHTHKQQESEPASLRGEDLASELSTLVQGRNRSFSDDEVMHMAAGSSMMVSDLRHAHACLLPVCQFLIAVSHLWALNIFQLSCILILLLCYHGNWGCYETGGAWPSKEAEPGEQLYHWDFEDNCTCLSFILPGVSIPCTSHSQWGFPLQAQKTQLDKAKLTLASCITDAANPSVEACISLDVVGRGCQGLQAKLTSASAGDSRIFEDCWCIRGDVSAMGGTVLAADKGIATEMEQAHLIRFQTFFSDKLISIASVLAS